MVVVLGGALSLAGYRLLVGSWLRPWYVRRALVPAALNPARRAPLLAVVLSATVFGIHLLTGAPERLYHDCSLPALVLPLVLVAIVCLVRSRRRNPAPAIR